MVERLFLAMPQGCLQFVIVVFPDHTHLLYLNALVQNSFEQLLDLFNFTYLTDCIGSFDMFLVGPCWTDC